MIDLLPGTKQTAIHPIVSNQVKLDKMDRPLQKGGLILPPFAQWVAPCCCLDGMASLMKQMAGMGVRDRFKQMQDLQKGLSNPAAQLQKPKGDTGKRLTPQERAKLRKDREKEARRRKRDGGK